MKSVFGVVEATIGGRTMDGDCLMLFKEKGALSAVGRPEWEKLTLTVDSGASDTVVPPTVCQGAQLLKTGEKCGIEYEIADGSSIENLGERHCLMKATEAKTDATMEMRFQVVDVSKALRSVHRMVQQGHSVLLAEDKIGEEGGSAILINGDPKNRIPLRHAGGTYELDVWLKPSQPFGGQR